MQVKYLARLSKLISKLVPENDLKNGLRKLFYFIYYPLLCNYISNNQDYDFKMSYKKGIFEYSFKTISIKMYNDSHFDLGVTLKGFLMNYKPKPRDIIIDGGSHKGAFAIYMAKLVPDGKVVLFEPDEKNFGEVLKNIKLNKLDNIIPINKGLWSEDSTLNFYKSKISSRSTLLDTPDITKERSLCRIPVVNLMNELNRQGIENPDFIKMDIDGAEIEVVKSIGYTLKKYKVNLAIASYHKINNKPTHLFLEDFFHKIGYNVFTSFEQHLTTYAFKEI